MASTPPLNKADFLGLDTNTWLFTGAESPPHRGVVEAVSKRRRSNHQSESDCGKQVKRPR